MFKGRVTLYQLTKKLANFYFFISRKYPFLGVRLNLSIHIGTRSFYPNSFLTPIFKRGCFFLKIGGFLVLITIGRLYFKSNQKTYTKPFLK